MITFALFWGTLSIILLLAFGRGLTSQFRISFSGLGDTLIMVSGGQTSLNFQGLPKGRPVALFPEDVDELAARIPEILRIAPESYSSYQISAGGKEINRTVHGTTAEFAALRSQVARAGGRFFNVDDVKFGRKVAFLGWKAATDLFGAAEPVGRTIVINRIPFIVIGVLNKKLQDSNYNGPDADQIYLPFHSYRQLDNRRRIDRIHIQPRTADQSMLIEERVRAVLGRKDRFDPADRYALGFWNTIESAKDGRGHLQGHRDLPGHHGGPDPAHRRRRGDQPDVRRGQGKDPGDRHQAGHRRPAAGHHPAVPAGDGLHLRQGDVSGAS